MGFLKLSKRNSRNSWAMHAWPFEGWRKEGQLLGFDQMCAKCKARVLAHKSGKFCYAETKKIQILRLIRDHLTSGRAWRRCTALPEIIYILGEESILLIVSMRVNAIQWRSHRESVGQVDPARFVRQPARPPPHFLVCIVASVRPSFRLPLWRSSLLPPRPRPPRATAFVLRYLGIAPPGCLAACLPACRFPPPPITSYSPNQDSDIMPGKRPFCSVS